MLAAMALGLTVREGLLVAFIFVTVATAFWWPRLGELIAVTLARVFTRDRRRDPGSPGPR